MPSKFYKGLVIAFIVFWVAFIFLDYWQKHPVYYLGFKHFQYFDLIAIYTLIGAGFVFGLRYIKKHKKFLFLTSGLSLFFLGLVLAIIAVQVFMSKNGQPSLDPKGIVTIIGKISYTAFGLYFITVVSYVLGNTINKFFPIKFKSRIKLIIDLAMGILGVVGICFLLGVVFLLKWYTLLPIFVGILAWRWRESLDFVKRTLISPLKISKHFNAFGAALFYILILFLSLNFLQTNVPFPRGWDALAVYVNMPLLIDDYSGLVSGFLPYNWSIFMSIGAVLFKSVEMVMGFSFLGGILTLLAMYALCRSWLGMNPNYSMLALLVFYTFPSVGFQCYLEQKIDLGLLFVSLSVFMVLINWIETYQKDKEALLANPETIVSNKFLNPHMALLGLLTGFAIGIKLTTLFSFFGVLSVMWFVMRGNWGFLSMFSMSVFLMLLLRVDERTRLRVYHLSADTLTWLMLGVGLVLLGITFIKNKKDFIKAMRLSVVYGLFLLIPFVPWLVKNAVDAGGNITVDTLASGKSAAPITNIQVFKKNWENYKKQQNNK